MADWYVSSTNFATVPAWTATTAKNIGDLVKATAPASGKEYVFRCTTAGTTASVEPTWSTAYTDGLTKTDGTVTWTNVTGRAAYGWSAAAGTLYSIFASTWSRPSIVTGDRVFLSSDHVENLSQATSAYGGTSGPASYTVIQLISVNKAGSVPPVSADIQSGARLTLTATSGTGDLEFDSLCNFFWQGITFTLTGGGATALHFYFNASSSQQRTLYFKNCAFVMSALSNGRMCCTSGTANVVFDNTTVQFGHINNWIGPQSSGSFLLTWINTPNAIQGAVIPTALFNCNVPTSSLITCRGVDLSAITTTLIASPLSSNGHFKALFDSCKIAPNVIRLAPTATGFAGTDFDEIELVNCWDGTNVLNERYQQSGAVTTDRTNIMSGGAADDLGAYSLKLASSSRCNNLASPLSCFALDAENLALGVPKTASVEFMASALLGADDVRLQVEYMGALGNPVASFVDTLSDVFASSPFPTSTAPWTVPSVTTVFNAKDLSGVTLSNNNLTTNSISGSAGGARTLNSISSGKYYWEYTLNGLVSGQPSIGLCSASTNLAGSFFNAAIMDKTGSVYVNGVFWLTLGTRAVNDVIGVAVDVTAGLLWVRVAPAGLWNASGSSDPAAGTAAIPLSTIGTGPFYGCFLSPGASSGDIFTANFGATSFTGAVPSGFNPGIPGAMTKQTFQLSFTPQRAGRIRGIVRLGRTGISMWVNPQAAIS